MDANAYQTLEGELADEQLSRLLVPTDLTESDGTRLITMGLLDTAGGRGGLASGLGGTVTGSQHLVCKACRARRVNEKLTAACGEPCHQWTYGRSA